MSLAKIYEDYFKIGAAVNTKTIQTKDFIKTHFNSLTCENEMKFESIHPKEDCYTFDKADKIVEFAKSINLKMRGHTLIWHNQTPNWVFEGTNGKEVKKELLYERMKSHIQTTMARYKDVIYAWDVVNEAVADHGQDLYRNSNWFKILGEEFIEKAFLYSHEVDPNVDLFYNDYNTTHPIKRDKIIKLIKNLQSKGIPIHGIGMQGHWNIESPSLDDIKQAISMYASLGLKLHITELDLSVFAFEDERKDYLKPEKHMLEKQANRYEQIFQLFREYKEVIESVTFWGVSDDYTWLDQFPVKNRKNWPFVFDETQKPKESYLKITQFNR